jgi:hypothetical protein
MNQTGFETDVFNTLHASGKLIIMPPLSVIRNEEAPLMSSH